MTFSKFKLVIYLSSSLLSLTILFACNQTSQPLTSKTTSESAPALFESNELVRAKIAKIISVTDLDSKDLNNEEVNIEPLESEQSVAEQNNDLTTQAKLPTVAGITAYYRTNGVTYQIWKHAQATDIKTLVYSSTNEVQSVAVTGDGNMIVASIINPAHGNYDVYVFDNGNPIINLSNTNGKDELDISIAAGGTKIVWSAPLNNGLIKIRVCDYDSVTQSCAISQLGATQDQRQASITSDGSYITLIRDLNNGKYRVLLYDVMNDTYTTVITRFDELSHPSADNAGNKVMYLRDRTTSPVGKYVIKIKDLNSSQITNELSSATTSHTHITSDGDYFAYNSQANGFKRAFTRNIDTNQRASAAGGNWDYGGGFWQKCPVAVNFKLETCDQASLDRFGFSVAISGDTAVVGAIGDDDGGSDSGSAYIFKRSISDEWILVKKIRSSDGETDDWFGYSVAISGDTIVVGAWGDDDNDDRSGSVYVYERDEGGSNNWGQVKKILASDGGFLSSFGNSVGMSGDTIAVGSRWDYNGGTTGSAYIYERDEGGNNNWGEVKKIVALDAEDFDVFGASVAISGDTVVVGANWNDDNGKDSGSAYVYGRNNGGNNNWGQIRKILPSDGTVADSFGASVAISGNTVVVGAYKDDDNGGSSGSAYVFRRNSGGNNNWGQVKKILPSDGTAGDWFGASVAVSGDTVAVGAWLDDDNGTESGSVYTFERNNGGNNNWGESNKILAPDGTAGDNFGSAIAKEGNTIVVAAWQDDASGINSGSTYIMD